MMTPEEAYVKLTNGNLLMKVRSCLDFGTFYAFSLAPLNVKDDDDYCSGTVFDAVDKETGRVFTYDITDSPDAFFNAERLNVDTFLDMPVENLKAEKRG